MAESNAPLTEPTWISLDAMFRTAVDHPIATNWRAHADTAYRFEQGDQWTPSELDALKARGQPPIVENEIRPTVERLLGQFRRQHTSIKFIGRNATDDRLAAAQSDLLRHIDYVNQYEFTEAKVVRDMLIGGFGVLEAIVRSNELGQMQVRYRWEDPFSLFVDPYCRSYDWNLEARFLARSKWLYEEEGRLLWPNKAKEIAQCVNTSQPSPSTLGWQDPPVLQNRNWWNLYYDQTNRRFRPVEIWYKQRAIRRIIETADGVRVIVKTLSASSAQDAASAIGAVVHEESFDRLWMAVYCGGIMLEEPKPSPYRCDKFPFVPYYAYRKADGEPQGYVWNLIDPNREINARRSKAMWALNNRQTVYERNAVRDKTELATEMARMDGQIEIEPGKFDKFAIRENQDISQGNLAMLQEAKVAIRRISGEDQINPAPEIRSGSGLRRIEQAQQNAVITLFDHIRQSRRLKADLTYAYIQQYYTDEMVFQITEDPGMVRTVRLSASDFETIKAQVYDLIATDTQDYLNSKNEQLDMLMTTLPQVIQFGPQWAGLLIQLTDLRNKEGLMQIIQSMASQPPADPKVAVSMTWVDLPAEEKAAWAVRWKMPELAQAIMATHALPGHIIKAIEGITKVKMKSEAQLAQAELTHHGSAADREANLTMEAMRGLAAMRTQQLDQQHEQSMAAMEGAANEGT